MDQSSMSGGADHVIPAPTSSSVLLQMGLGVVETIYEEEENEGLAAEASNSSTTRSYNHSPTSSISDDDDDHNHTSSSSTAAAVQEEGCAAAINDQLSFPSLDLKKLVREWCEATGIPTDVTVRVEDQSFDLHMSVLIRRSLYVKEHTKHSCEFTLNPISKINPEIFDMIASFCYGADLVVTPSNVVSLMCATEFLLMAEDEQDGDRMIISTVNNHCQQMETFFSNTILSNREDSIVVLSSCIPLLPESERLMIRCIETLASMDNIGDDHSSQWMNHVMKLPHDVFTRIVESLKCSSICNHDIVYEMIDSFLKAQEETITQEEREQIYGAFDFSRLSPRLLIRVVQNPKMPLRHIVHTMFIHQLKARHAISWASVANSCKNKLPKDQEAVGISFGAILERDAARRESMLLRAEMEATYLRIRLLEEELKILRRELDELQEKDDEERCDVSSIKSSKRSSSTTNIDDRKEKGGRKKVLSSAFMKGLGIVFGRPKLQKHGFLNHDQEGQHEVPCREGARVSLHRRSRSFA